MGSQSQTQPRAHARPAAHQHVYGVIIHCQCGCKAVWVGGRFWDGGSVTAALVSMRLRHPLCRPRAENVTDMWDFGLWPFVDWRLVDAWLSDHDDRRFLILNETVGDGVVIEGHEEKQS